MLSPVQFGEYTLDAGSIVSVSPSLSHMDEVSFPDPRRWNPERDQNKVEGAFVGFGAGVHKCLGEKFGILQVKTVVATILNEFELEPCRPLPESDYTTMVVGPTRSQAIVRYTRRQK